MYCVKCGVELEDSLDRCPLCHTTVYHPELPRPQKSSPYPPRQLEEERFSPSGILFVISAFLLMCDAVVLLCDLSLNGYVGWSGIVIGATVLFYVALIMPSWFSRPKTVVFLPLTWGLILLYLFYIDLYLSGGWFLSFAFPVAGGLGACVCSGFILHQYLRRGRLYIMAGCLSFFGAYSLLIEFLADITFGLPTGFQWAFYPLIVLCMTGGAVLVVAICRPLRDSLRKKLFL